MQRRFAALLPIALAFLVGCSHSADTVVHFSAAPGSGWVACDPAGARLCSLPCTVELDANETVVIAREGGNQFVVHQENLGAGAWSGAVRVRREPSQGALAIQAFSGALMTAGTTLVETKREDRVSTGVLLSGLGAIGLLASSAWPGKPREELWLERTTPP